MSFDERLVLNKDSRANIIYDEHLVRYQLAATLVKGKRVLDIACGSGYGTKLLAQAGGLEIVGVDIDEKAVREAEKNYSHPATVFKTGDSENIEEADESFDVIVSFETIEHLKNPNKYLSEIARVLKTGGLALISTPNKDVFGQKNPYHLHEFSRQEFEQVLSKFFSNISLLEQVNGLASLIKGEKSGNVSFSAPETTPLYFIAICAKNNVILPKELKESFVSVNPMALDKMRHNPVLKLSDKIYSLFKF